MRSAGIALRAIRAAIWAGQPRRQCPADETGSMIVAGSGAPSMAPCTTCSSPPDQPTAALASIGRKPMIFSSSSGVSAASRADRRAIVYFALREAAGNYGAAYLAALGIVASRSVVAPRGWGAGRGPRARLFAVRRRLVSSGGHIDARSQNERDRVDPRRTRSVRPFRLAGGRRRSPSRRDTWQNRRSADSFIADRPRSRPCRGPGGVGKTELARSCGGGDGSPPHPVAVLRGARRIEGALRVELQEAAAPDPGRRAPRDLVRAEETSSAKHSSSARPLLSAIRADEPVVSSSRVDRVEVEAEALMLEVLSGLPGHDSGAGDHGRVAPADGLS